MYKLTIYFTKPEGSHHCFVETIGHTVHTTLQQNAKNDVPARARNSGLFQLTSECAFPMSDCWPPARFDFKRTLEITTCQEDAYPAAVAPLRSASRSPASIARFWSLISLAVLLFLQPLGRSRHVCAFPSRVIAHLCGRDFRLTSLLLAAAP